MLHTHVHCSKSEQIQISFVIFRGLDDDPEGHAEMQLEQALDDNDLVYHDNMIAANSWWKMNYSFSLKKNTSFFDDQIKFLTEKKKLYSEKFIVVSVTSVSYIRLKIPDVL